MAVGVSLALNVLALGGAGYYVADRGVTVTAEKLGIVEPPRPDFTRLASERFASMPGAPVVFVGDSQVQNARWSELLGRSVANRGIGGQTIADTATWIGQVLERPDVTRLVVWAGTNDVLQDRPPTQSGADMAALLERVRDARPDVAVTVLTVPVLPSSPDQSRATNQAIAAAAEDAGAQVVDVVPALARTGALDADGVHASIAGYEAVARLLGQVVG